MAELGGQTMVTPAHLRNSPPKALDQGIATDQNRTEGGHPTSLSAKARAVAPTTAQALYALEKL